MKDSALAAAMGRNGKAYVNRSTTAGARSCAKYERTVLGAGGSVT